MNVDAGAVCGSDIEEDNVSLGGCCGGGDEGGLEAYVAEGIPKTPGAAEELLGIGIGIGGGM
jgi:hypothetical protein